jgi:hypothetical protein
MSGQLLSYTTVLRPPSLSRNLLSENAHLTRIKIPIYQFQGEPVAFSRNLTYPRCNPKTNDLDLRSPFGREKLTELLIAKFPEWLVAYDQFCPFTRQRRRALGVAETALGDEGFLKSLYRTLQAWRIGARASKLRPFEAYLEAWRRKKAEIIELDGMAIDQIDLDILAVSRKTARLIQSLDIVENRVRAVPGSKALHHLLSELVVPLDREYTQWFFDWPNPRLQYNPEECFVEAFHAFAQIARACNPVQNVGASWYTSRTKVIDNAIVGLSCWAKHQVKGSAGPQNGDTSTGRELQIT